MFIKTEETFHLNKNFFVSPELNLKKKKKKGGGRRGVLQVRITSITKGLEFYKYTSLKGCYICQFQAQYNILEDNYIPSNKH